MQIGTLGIYIYSSKLIFGKFNLIILSFTKKINMSVFFHLSKQVRVGVLSTNITCTFFFVINITLK